MDESAGRFRYRMLETVRQYAQEKLVDEGEAEAARTRHLGYFLDLAEELEPKIHAKEHIETLDRLDLELDNLRQALEWSLQTDVTAEMRLAGALRWFWHIRFRITEGIPWLEQGLALDQPAPAGAAADENRLLARARALDALGDHYLLKGAYYALPAYFQFAKNSLLESLALYRGSHLAGRAETKLGTAWVQSNLSTILLLENDRSQAWAMLEEAMSAFRAASDIHGMAECALDLVRFSFSIEKDFEYLQQALALFQQNSEDIMSYAAA